MLYRTNLALVKLFAKASKRHSAEFRKMGVAEAFLCFCKDIEVVTNTESKLSRNPEKRRVSGWPMTAVHC